jgi:WD40 repeat protein
VLNTDSGRVLRCIRAMSSEINQLLCCSLNSAHATKTFLVSTTNQIKIYEYDKFTRKSEFSFGNEMRIKFVKWMPCDDKVLAILRNDIICVFGDGNSLKPIRRYDPLKAREKFLRKSNQRVEMMKYVDDDCENKNHRKEKLIMGNDYSGKMSTN